MSETDDYPLRAHVEMYGYDTVRYAVAKADSVLTLHAEMTGFQAFLRSFRKQVPVVQVDMTSQGTKRAVALADITESLRQQIGPNSIRNITLARDSLRLELTERYHKTYRVDLGNVDFSFADQYGLYGEPVVKPEDVTLYGPKEALDRITSVSAISYKVVNISSSGSYEIPLDDSWRDYGDIRSSATAVTVHLPVEAYVDREYSVPIEVVGADTNVHYRIYPEEATVHVWVPKSALDKTPEFRVAIDYQDILNHESTQTPRLLEFPSYLRPRSLEPSQVECVIIR